MSENANFNNIDNLPENIREVLLSFFRLYVTAKKHKDLYKEDIDQTIVKNIIKLYFSLVNPDYNKLIYNFKNKYIANEILLEKNDSLNERRGIALVYDYIQNYDVNKDDFNIFICSMLIHSKLYHFFDVERISDSQKKLEEITRLQDEAKEEKNLQKYKMSVKLKEELSTSDFDKFGGRLRKDEATMQNIKVRVPLPKEASLIMNSYLSNEKKEEYLSHLENDDIFEYVGYCVKTIVDLIATQPFQDGNKRTFRALLNLMFKKRNIPPVYVGPKEREEYKDALIEALEKKNYDRIVGFYYYKICDSIYELDIRPYMMSKNDQRKPK